MGCVQRASGCLRCLTGAARRCSGRLPPGSAEPWMRCPSATPGAVQYASNSMLDAHVACARATASPVVVDANLVWQALLCQSGRHQAEDWQGAGVVCGAGCGDGRGRRRLRRQAVQAPLPRREPAQGGANICCCRVTGLACVLMCAGNRELPSPAATDAGATARGTRRGLLLAAGGGGGAATPAGCCGVCTNIPCVTHAGCGQRSAAAKKSAIERAAARA